MIDTPLLFGKPSDKAILTPDKFIASKKKIYKIGKVKFPKYCILSFFRSLDEIIKKQDNLREYNLNPAYGQPIYTFDYKGTKIAYNVPGFGASFVGAQLEELIALGMEYFVFVGAVGILQRDIKRGEIVIPSKAIRDEGTSYHYALPSKYSYPSKNILKVVTEFLNKRDICFHFGPTWTIDAPYRETVRKIKKYQTEGCLSVEMEASALFAVANYRKKHIGGIFLAGDLVAEHNWNPRLKEKDSREKKFEKSEILNIVLRIFHDFRLSRS